MSFSILGTHKSAVFGPTCSCSQDNLSLKSLRRVPRHCSALSLSVQFCPRRQFNKTFLGNEIPVSQSVLDQALTLWTSLWFNTAPSPGHGEGRLGLCPEPVHTPASVPGHETTILNSVLIPSVDQIPLSFTHPSLVVYQRWLFFQEGTSLSVSFSPKVNSIGTTLWKYLKLNLLQDSHHQPPQVAHICSWLFPYRSCTDLPWKTSLFWVETICLSIHLSMTNSPLLFLLG